MNGVAHVTQAPEDSGAVGAVNGFLFGDQSLHKRFSMAIELLARIMIAHPHGVTSAKLAEGLGYSPRDVRSLLVGLHKSGLVQLAQGAKDTWHCGAALERITLADIFLSVSAAAAAMASQRGRRGEAPTADVRSAAQQSVELLLMQATMAINQTVLRHLQNFDLGRLKAVGSSDSHRLNRHSYFAEPC